MSGRPGAVERRAWPRRPARECTWLGAARLRPGREVRVLDATAGGLQLETAVRLLPGASVELHLLVSGTLTAISGRVVRSRVAVVRPRILYRAGIAFDKPLVFGEANEEGSEYQLPATAAAKPALSGRSYP